ATRSHLHEPDDLRRGSPRGHGLRLRLFHFIAAHDPYLERRNVAIMLRQRLRPLGRGFDRTEDNVVEKEWLASGLEQTVDGLDQRRIGAPVHLQRVAMVDVGASLEVREDIGATEAV